MSFRKVTLEECCDILDNQRIPLNADQRFEIQGEFPYYGANGVQGFISKFVFDDDLILLAEDGGNFGEFSTRPIAYRVKGKCWVNNHAHVLKAKENFSHAFIFYSLEHKDILNFVSGGTRAKLNQGELKKITIQHPLLKEEADRISDIITQSVKAIEQTENLIAKYQRIKTGLMQDLLTKGIDENGNIRSEPTHKFKTEKGLRVPEEWSVNELGAINNFITSGSRNWAQFYSIEGALFLRITNLTRENINFLLDDMLRVNVKNNDEGKRTKLQKDDILISITADLGVIGVIPKEFEEAYVNQHIALFRILDKEGFDSRFIGHFLSSSFAQEQFSKLNDGGAKAGLNLPTILKVKFPKMNIKEQKKISSRLDKCDELVKQQKSELSKLQSLKTGLMQDLLTGKVRVKIKEAVANVY